MSYYLSPALEQLRAQINEAYDDRDKSSDGWIGDTSHAARTSDHNPDWSAGGIVRALDIDEDLVIGLTAVGEAMPLAEAILRDPRTRYVIYEGRLAYGAHVPGVPRGWQPYTGPNAHRHHIHVSVRRGARYDRDARPWALGTTPIQEDTMSAQAEQSIAAVEDAIAGTINDEGKEISPREALERTLRNSRQAVAKIVRLEKDAATRHLADLGRHKDLAKIVKTIDAGATPDDIDPKALAEALAAALPPTIARDVVDALGAQLAK